MEPVFESLSRFFESNNCIFQFKSIDYPTEFQQHLITNYFQMSNFLKVHPHNEIVKLLHTEVKYLQMFIPGILYQMLLDPANGEYFQAYMPTLRTQSWSNFSKLILHLLRDSFLWIKPHLRAGIIPLLSKLFYYHQLQVDHIILAVKTIDYTDLTEHSLNYNNEMLAFFQQILFESGQKTFYYVLAKTLFYKIFRMLGLLVCIEDDVLRQYKLHCVTVAQRIFQLERQRCLMIGNSGLNVFKELQREQLLTPLLSQLNEALTNCQTRPESAKSAALRLSCVLPMKVETTLLFIIKENISKMEIKLQLDWTFQRNKEQSLFVVIDILRYILAMPADELPMKQCLYILQWLFYRVCSNNILFEIWKDELFFACFLDPCPFPAAPERAIHFLAYLLDVDADFGEMLLIFLLRHSNNTNKKEGLRNVLIRADELQILNLSGIINHPRLRLRTKEELVNIVGQKTLPQPIQPSNEEVYYDPLAFHQRKQSYMSQQFSDSDSSEHYLNSPQENIQIGDEETIQRKVIDGQVSRIKLEKMFVEDMGESLGQLLNQSTLPCYRQFYKKMIAVTKDFRVSGQQSLIDLFLGESAKITYLLFQNQFQNHTDIIPKQDNIIFFLLNIVAVEWRTNSFHGQISKKLIKKIAEYFPTAELTIFRNFLLFFKRNLVPVTRQMKEWIFVKQKVEYAIPLLRELGPLPRQLIENAQSLKIPTSF